MFALPNPPNGHIPDSLAQLHTSLSIITFSFITISQPALLGLLSRSFYPLATDWAAFSRSLANSLTKTLKQTIFGNKPHPLGGVQAFLALPDQPNLAWLALLSFASVTFYPVYKPNIFTLFTRFRQSSKEEGPQQTKQTTKTNRL